MKSRHQQQVEEFMQFAGQGLPDKPTIPPFEVRELRAKLILEECLETIEALGFYVWQDDRFCHSLHLETVDDYGKELQPDLEEIIDGCADIAVVTTGTLSACGIPDLPFQDEVNLNNLAKFGPGHSIRTDGKIIKPPDHKPPNIRGILNQLKG
ncbi:MAG: hypothetical protein ACHQ1D_00440 [Nitrososphaerales archaeon]